MKTKVYNGIPYHLWNPFTEMEEFMKYLGFGPLVVSRGEGPYIFNDRGKRFINGFSSLWNVAIGHGRVELAEVAASQMKELAYASCFRQVHPKAIELAAKLVDITGNYYQQVYLGSNGSEAVETSIKMARQYHKQSPDSKDHGKYKILSLKNSYHGVTYTGISSSGLPEDNEKFGPLIPGFFQIDPPYCFRCPYGEQSHPDCNLKCAKALETSIQEQGPDSIAAFIFEPIMGANGIIKPPEEYYHRVGEICREHGVLLIADEVTTGFGRTGKLFVSQDWKIRPDILLLAKGISSGYLPLSATLATALIYERFLGKGNQFEHGSTASGHPVCAAVGLANIDIILNENLSENALKVGEILKTGLKAIMEKNKIIGDVRGSGLMIGIELVKDKTSKEPLADDKVWNHILDLATLGLLAYYKGNVIGLMPPLIINETVVNEILTAFEKGINTGMQAEIGRKTRLLKEFAEAKLKI
jgi:taurine-pyruvate aminotransferase